LRAAQPMPKTLFRVRGVPAQFPRELDAPHPCPLPAMRGEGVSSLPTRRALGRTTDYAGPSRPRLPDLARTSPRPSCRLHLPASRREIPSSQPSPASGKGRICAFSSPHRGEKFPHPNPLPQAGEGASASPSPPSPRMAGRGPG
jgi:hypothetical protein